MSAPRSRATASSNNTSAVNERAAAIERRKSEHLTLASGEGVETRVAAGWDEIHLVHDAFPQIDSERVDLSADLLGRTLRLPLVISGMTGGHRAAHEVNSVLAMAAERHGVAFGVGSQRAA